MNSDNKVYWTKDNILPSEQGKTTLSHFHGKVTGVRMIFNPIYDQKTDFATLVRHELTHVIGFASHTDNGLMETHLRNGEVKFWDLKLLNSWIKDMNREVSLVEKKEDTL